MKIAPSLRDFLFRCLHAFRGAPVEIGGHRFRVDESLRRWNFAGEEEAQAILKEKVRPGDVVLDIGANFGMHTMLAAELAGIAGRVFAFEPVSANLRLLERNVQLNGFQDRVRIIRSAVSNSPEPYLSFSIPSDELSVTGTISSFEMDANCHQVSNVRLDTCPHLKRPVRFIKIDVEGAELAVLKGGENLIRQDKPVILVEVHVYAFERFGVTLDGWRDYILTLGYRETALNERNYGGTNCYHALLVPEDSSRP